MKKMRAERSISKVSRGHVSDRKQMLRFAGVFLALVAAFYAVTLSPWVDASILLPVMKVSARSSSALLNLAGVKTTVEGVVVRGPGYAVAVLRGCDPLEPIVLFAAAVIAFPAAWRRRLPGLVIGSGFLFCLNLVRISSLFLLGANKSALLDSFHLCWWPAAFIVCSLGLWVLWLRWIQSMVPNSNSHPPTKPIRPQPRPPTPAGSS